MQHIQHRNKALNRSNMDILFIIYTWILRLPQNHEPDLIHDDVCGLWEAKLLVYWSLQEKQLSWFTQ